MQTINRLFLIVLDSFGMGALPDAAEYGDEGSNTLAAVAASPRFHAPNLQRLGLFNIEGVDAGLASLRAPQPLASFARLAEQSAGKDTTIGHWEMAGLISKTPFPTYPGGFPPEVIVEYEKLTGHKVLCNKPYSGTKVIHDYGRQSIAENALIVYTSADSVFQVAGHEEVIGLQELYRCCQIARDLLVGRHRVGRVIARPFVGEYPNYKRTANRHDYAVAPDRPTMLNCLQDAGLDTIGVGKIYDIFAGDGVSEKILTKGNNDGMDKTLELVARDFNGLCFVNLVDFDMVYGHRNDVYGYAQAVTDFDVYLGRMLPLLKNSDVLIITADHGCDPSTESTDHSREYVPLLVYGAGIREGRDLGTRDTFADIAATVEDFFGLPCRTDGKSFMAEIVKGNSNG